MESKVYIYQEPWADAVCLTLIRRMNGKSYVAKMKDVEFVEHKEYERTEPTLRLSQLDAVDLFKQLADAFDKQGVKTDSDAKTAGILEATKAHLYDLQKLVFKQRKI